MKTLLLSLASGSVLLLPQAFAQSPTATASPAAHGLDTPAALTAPVSPSGPATAAGMPNEAEMMKQMMEMSKLNENHKLLADMTGTWKYTTKMWMAPGAPPQESKGTAVRKPMMGGRYFVGDFDGKIMMPGPDGKPREFEFKGHEVDGYDNVKKKFVSSWIDNMGTGIVILEGSYDPAAKAITYQSEMEMMPGMKTHVREVVSMPDKDHQHLEWYETMMGGNELKTMEIDSVRSK